MLTISKMDNKEILRDIQLEDLFDCEIFIFQDKFNSIDEFFIELEHFLLDLMLDVHFDEYLLIKIIKIDM